MQSATGPTTTRDAVWPVIPLLTGTALFMGATGLQGSLVAPVDSFELFVLVSVLLSAALVPVILSREPARGAAAVHAVPCPGTANTRRDHGVGHGRPDLGCHRRRHAHHAADSRVGQGTATVQPAAGQRRRVTAGG